MSRTSFVNDILNGNLWMQLFDNDVDDSDVNKQYWLEELRSNVLRCFDISIVQWEEQPESSVNTVWKMMAADWDYVGGEFGMKKFKSHCRAILKRNRHTLHKFWINECKQDRRKPGPSNVDPAKWARLVDHFTSPAMLTNSLEMKRRRLKLVNTSLFGRGGLAAAAKRVVRSCGIDIKK